MSKTRQALFLVFAAFLSTAAGPCKGKHRIEPVASAGKISIVVIDAKGKDLGGQLAATYSVQNENWNYEHKETRTFRGHFELPMRANVDGAIDVALTHLAIGRRSSETALVDFDAYPQFFDELKQLAISGARLSVILDPSAVQGVKVMIRGPGALPVTMFEPGSSQLPKPPTTDPSQPATPESFHRSLLKRAESASTIDVAGVNALVDACTWSWAKRVELQTQYRALLDANDPRYKTVAKEIELAEQFSSYVNRIIEAALPKASDLTLENGMAVLEKLYPRGGASSAFRAVISKGSPLSGPRKLELLELARRKGETGVALGLAKEWFRADSDKSVATLLTLVDKFSTDARDALLLGSLDVFAALSEKEAESLVSVAWGERLKIGLQCLPKIDALDAARLAALASLYSTDSRDAILKAGFARLGVLTVSEVELLVNASWGERLSIGLGGMAKIPVLEVDAIVRIASLFSTDSRDAIVRAGIARLNAVKLPQLEALVNATWGERLKNALALLPKIRELNVMGLVEVSGLFSTDSRDAVLLAGLDRFPSLSVVEVLALVKSAWGIRLQLAKTCLPRIPSLTAAGAVAIANQFSTDSRDEIVSMYLKRTERLPTDDLLLLQAGAWAIRASMLTANIGKLTDLTVANAIRITDTVSTGSRDEFLLAAVGLVTDLTSSNLETMAIHAWASRDEILAKGRKRLGL